MQTSPIKKEVKSFEDEQSGTPMIGFVTGSGEVRAFQYIALEKVTLDSNKRAMMFTFGDTTVSVLLVEWTPETEIEIRRRIEDTLRQILRHQVILVRKGDLVDKVSIIVDETGDDEI